MGCLVEVGELIADNLAPSDFSSCTYGGVADNFF